MRRGRKERDKLDILIPREIRIKDLTQRTVAILGQKGTGKTFLANIFLNRLKAKKTPVIVFDPVGELVKIAKTRHKFILDGFGITFQNKLRELWDKKQIICIETYEPEIADECMKWILDNLENGVVIFDEIGDYLPQFRGFYCRYGEFLIKKGRNKNQGFIMISQRPQTINKNVLALADYFILFRLVASRDVEQSIEPLKLHLQKEEYEALILKLQKLRVGQVICVDFLK